MHGMKNSSGWLMAMFGLLLVVVLLGCGGSGEQASEQAAGPTATPDPLADIAGKQWVATLASGDIMGVGGSVELTLEMYESGDARADVPMVGTWTGTYTLADDDTLRFEWEGGPQVPSIPGVIEFDDGPTIEFWTFDLQGDELIMTNDSSGDRRVYRLAE